MTVIVAVFQDSGQVQPVPHSGGHQESHRQVSLSLVSVIWTEMLFSSLLMYHSILSFCLTCSDTFGMLT